MKKFITLEEAMEILDNNIGNLDSEKIELIDAVNRRVCKEIKSIINNPPFNKSAMDGYALIASDTTNIKDGEKIKLKIIDEVFAGEVCKSSLNSNTTIKIMTGAPMPVGATAVVKQECVSVINGFIEIGNVAIENQNICFAGEDIKIGQCLVKKNKKLDYADIGILASSGINKIEVYKKPRIAIISTGDEILDITEGLTSGKIYNSNKYSLMARVKELGYDVSLMKHVSDSADKISDAIHCAARDVDLVITTGGASVGEKDLVIKAIDLIQGEKLFWKIKIKPGSAVLCSKVNNTTVISLSGNPTAALTTFELLVKTALEKLNGKKEIKIEREKAILVEDITKKSTQRRFIRARVSCDEKGQQVYITQTKSGNGILSSALNSNCLVEIEAGNLGVKKGEVVNIIKL